MTLSVLAECADWNYDNGSPNGPQSWGNFNKNCDGQRQSPVNINPLRAQLSGPRITVKYHNKKPTSVNYSNDGHGYTISFNFADGIQPTIIGGPLGADSFVFHSLHIHWKSEHSVLGALKDAELHMVHFNSKYTNLSMALQKDDGLAVLGFLYEVSYLCLTFN